MAEIDSVLHDINLIGQLPHLRPSQKGTGLILSGGLSGRKSTPAPAPQSGGALRGGSALGLPFPARRAAPGEAVIASRRLAGDDDMMPHQMAGHAT
jgi:hypothetical protein